MLWVEFMEDKLGQTQFVQYYTHIFWTFCSSFHQFWNSKHWSTTFFPLLFLSLGSSEAPREPVSAGSVDLSELLMEIRHLRLQLERSIQTNTALRERLEEQLLRGANRSETININYLLSSPGKHTLITCDEMYASLQIHSQEVKSVLVLYFFQMKEAGHLDTTAAIVPVAHSRVRICRTHFWLNLPFNWIWKVNVCMLIFHNYNKTFFMKTGSEWTRFLVSLLVKSLTNMMHRCA